jgi:hypothetical protein
VASLLPLHNFYSILIRLLEPSSSEAGKTWVKNMAAEFCLQSIGGTTCETENHTQNLHYTILCSVVQIMHKNHTFITFSLEFEMGAVRGTLTINKTWWHYRGFSLMDRPVPPVFISYNR